MRGVVKITDGVERTQDLYSILERTICNGYGNGDGKMIDLETADWIIHPSRTIYCAYKRPCDYSVAVATDCMSEHCRTKHKYVDENIKCDVSEDCHFATYDETSLQNHKLHFHVNHFHNNSKRSWNCGHVYMCPNNCGYSGNKRDMTLHTNVHENSTFKCCFCQWLTPYGKNTEIVKHLKRHFKLPSYACEYCPEKYYSVTALNDHVNNRHVAEFSHKCPGCSQKFLSKKKQTRHMKICKKVEQINS